MKAETVRHLAAMNIQPVIVIHFAGFPLWILSVVRGWDTTWVSLSGTLLNMIIVPVGLLVVNVRESVRRHDAPFRTNAFFMVGASLVSVTLARLNASIAATAVNSSKLRLPMGILLETAVTLGISFTLAAVGSAWMRVRPDRPKRQDG